MAVADRYELLAATGDGRAGAPGDTRWREGASLGNRMARDVRRSGRPVKGTRPWERM
jgi:hypothetical protein